MADWAMHQARWLGATAIRNGDGGAVALCVATLWAIVAYLEHGADPPTAWRGWSGHDFRLLQRSL
eukprot:7125430-Alexandrium_andersonii.AAC.1